MIRLTRAAAIIASGASVAGTAASAQVASGTGSANTAVSSVGGAAGAASGTGAAFDTTVYAGALAAAENAVGSGSVSNSTPDVKVSAGLASGTGTASNPTAATTWLPILVANLYAWYDASDTATITASSNLVSQWDDKSGNARHLTQSTSARRPDSGTRTLNSLNVIDFDRTNTEFLKKTSFSLTQPFTIFAVVLADSYDTVGRYFDGYEGSTSGRALFHRSIGNWRVSAGSNGDTTRACATAAAKYHTVVFNSTSSLFRENGVQYGGTLSVGSGGAPQLNISSDGVSGGFWDGLVAEFFVYSAVISGTDLTNAESYLATKWGL